MARALGPGRSPFVPPVRIDADDPYGFACPILFLHQVSHRLRSMIVRTLEPSNYGRCIDSNGPSSLESRGPTLRS